MSAIPGSTTPHVASAPPGEEGVERKNSYEALSALVHHLEMEIIHSYNRKDLIQMNKKVKEVNLNHPYVAAVWKAADGVERLLEGPTDAEEIKKIAMLQTRVLDLQAKIYETAGPEGCAIL